MINSNNKKLYLSIFLASSLIIISGIAYTPILRGFFQHDEWRAFGHYLSGGGNLLSIFKPSHSHYAPLTQLLYYLYLSIFQLNFFWYALLSLFAHLIVVCLSFIFFSRLLKNEILAFFSSLPFAIGASGHQATSWIATDINTHGSTIFALLALIVLYKFNRIWLSIMFLIISLLFKEIAIAFFILLPLMVYIFDKKRFVKNRLSYFKVTLVGFIYLALRFSMVFFQRTNIEDRLVIETQSFSDVINNVISFPAKIVAQSLIPTGQLLSLARQVTKILPSDLTGLYGTTAFDVFTENVTLQIINWTIFIVSIFILIFLLRKAKDKIIKIKRTAIFGFLFVIFNSLIYVLSPGRSGSIPVVDSRNIYLPSLGTALFIVSIIYLLSKEKITKVFLFILPLLVLNIFWLEKELKVLVDRGTERKEILYQIKKTYPVLPKKVIFYMVSDKPFYGLPESEKIFPFETNLGYTIMVWYQLTESFPKEFLDPSDFLYGLTKEGYRKIGDRGFGYFRNWETLKKTVIDNNLRSDSVIAFSYNSNNKLIENITSQIRKEIDVTTGKIK